jgi:hypothetical protein
MFKYQSSIQRADCMSFLNWPLEQNQLSQHTRRRRKGVALSLLGQFGDAFREITYELLWESPTINAQAWRLGSARYVRVYGGLVRHRAITKYGLALMLAHETGHHLGGLPRDPDMPWMTWQGQADYWAANKAMPLLFGSCAREMTLRGARQIIRLQADLADSLENDQPDLSSECRHAIFRAGILGEGLPQCAHIELAKLSD